MAAADPIKPGASARNLIKETKGFLSRADSLLGAPKILGDEARKQSHALRWKLATAQLDAMPIERLRETTRGGLRLDALRRAGFLTVGQLVSANPSRLEVYPGVGPQTAVQAVAAARRIADTITEQIPVRLDPQLRETEHTHLLATIRDFGTAEQAAATYRGDLEKITPTLQKLMSTASPAGSRLKMLFLRSSRRAEVVAALDKLNGQMARGDVRALSSAIVGAPARPPRLDENGLWDDFLAHAADYFTALDILGEGALDAHAAEGFMPAEIVAKVNELTLDVRALQVSLRGYQAFGAKFALIQERTILGDEMGLGKTIEALAAFAHLSALGAKHFLVVCPASVLVNWIQEIERHSHLTSFRLHGSERDRQLRRWNERGGVAVTTYGSLGALGAPPRRIDMLVADEAHFVKNPDALRSRALVGWMAVADRALFLTGTPMENRPIEFRNLVNYLQPQVALNVSAEDHIAGAAAFQRAVAPAYLRRNQEDVLKELPERLEAEDWVELSGGDMDRYRSAVTGGNFMDMRRAAFRSGDPQESSKLGRLLEIVEESEANGWKVLVFSYFLDVLDIVGRAVGSAALPLLTGSVPPTRRQELVDRFSSIDGHAVLVSQIQAGGVGLNLQAASVVILTEPQWKPALEEQAIGRAHRMGQARRVHVHRLLAQDSVDQRMLEILRKKKDLFDAFVRQSAVKEASPDAVDISELELVDNLLTETAAERAIIQAERRRLRLDALE